LIDEQFLAQSVSVYRTLVYLPGLVL